ncbi:MAG: aminoacyl-tRNA hydrolase [Gammaproteobacteria bacterium]|nr:aminoacyl-tRNA hydrolase [Gammaproteobacteria bacterium]
MALQLVIGLGNPGPRYAETRHNAGFWFIERLAAIQAVNFSRESKFQGEVARLRGAGFDCWLLKPGTFMNDSGGPVQSFMQYYNVPPEQALIAHDEVDFAPGTARLKRAGGHGGHNGLRDIIERAGSSEFQRLRLGVGHPGDRDAVVSYVLNRPTSAERELIDAAIGRALEVMPLVLAGELEKAMTELHGF